MTEAQAWWLIVEVGILALVALVSLLAGYAHRRGGPLP